MASEHMLDKQVGKKFKSPTTSRAVLDKFTVLAEGNDIQRLQATKQLLYTLQKLQSVHRETQEDGLCGDVEYALGRLIKGLASNRKWARIGFATALTQLISTFDMIEIKTVLKVIEESLKFTKQESKSEKGHTQFGKVTAMVCIIRSDRLQPDSGEEYRAIIGCLNQLKSQKSYLLLPCVYGLEQLLLKVDKSTFYEHVLPELREQLTCGWETSDPNTILLLLTCQKKGLIDGSFLMTYWGAKSLLDRKNWKRIREIIIASGASHILLHRVNEAILEEIDRTGLSLVDMWKDSLVGLFVPGKKKSIYLGLYYLRAVIKTLTTKNQILEVFSFEICQMFHKNLIVQEKEWKEMAMSVANELVQVCTSIDEKHLQTNVIRHFLFHHFSFTENHFIKELIRQLKPDDAIEFCSDLMKIVQGDGLRESVGFQSDGLKCWAISELKFIISNSEPSEATDGTLSVLEFCLLHSFFTIETTSAEIRHVTALSSPLTDHVRNFLKDALSTLLNTLQRPGRKDLTAVLSMSYKLARYAESLLTEKSVSLIKELPEEAVDELSRSLDIVGKLQKKSAPTPDSQAFQILFLHLCFQLFLEPTEGLDIVKDVHVCFEKSQKKSKKASKNGDEEPAWMDVMTELLISLMSKSSRVTRSVTTRVFRLLSPHITKSSLDLIINVLVTEEDEDAEGGPISFQDKEEDSEDEETSKKPGQIVNGNHGNKDGDQGDQDGDTDESDDESSDDEQEEENGDVDEQLRQTVKAALGRAAAASDEEEESDGMNDEEMLRFDDALSEAFRSMQRGKSKETKNRKQQLAIFKLRTLDLLETFLQNRPPTELVVYLVSPILDMVESGLRHKEEMQLGKRANGLLNKIFKHTIKTDNELDNQEIMEKMEQLIEYSTKVSSLHMVNDVSRTFVFLMKVILNQDVPSSNNTQSGRKTRSSNTEATETHPNKSVFPDKVLAMLKKSLSDCLNRKDSRLHHIFFQTIIQRYSKQLWPLSGILLDCLNTQSIRVFLRTQAASLLSNLLMSGMTHIIGNKEWVKFVNIFTESMTKIIQGLNEDNFKPKYTQEILILVQKFVNIDKENGKILGEKLAEKFPSLNSKLPKQSKKVCNKIFHQLQLCLASATPGNVKKEKKKRIHEEINLQNEATFTVIKSPKLDDGDKLTDNKLPSPKKERRKSHKLSSSVNGDEVMSDSATPPLQMEGQTTPKKKKKSKNEAVLEFNSPNQDDSDASIKRKVMKKKTPRKKST